MTKIITRYFGDVVSARAAKSELVQRQRVSIRILDLYDKADGLAGRLEAQNVDPATAAAYEANVAKGGAVLLIKAGYKPLGVAKMMRTISAEYGGVPMDGMVEEVIVDDTRARSLSVMTDHPHFLFRPRDPDNTNVHMANWPIPLISRRKPFRGRIFGEHARMANWPIPLLSDRKPSDSFAFPRHARMANFPIPLLSDRKPRDNFAFPRHARMANFPIPLISRRKPRNPSWIGRHTRMANWPFPLLINGQRSTNALIPDGPRMANFPISLISKRKPSDAFAFPRHARMANFPLPLISKRKPRDAFAFPRHARMADFMIPLILRRSDEASSTGGKGFSVSQLFMLPTIIRR